MSTSNKKDNKYQIAVIPGDGIGKEVMEATISVLDELNVDFDYVYGIAGDECNEEHGTPLPQETIDIVRDSDACLFGAAGETAADVIVKIRQEMKMFANLRPVKSYPNTKSVFENVDFMIVRENTEGLYIANQEEKTEDGAIAKRIITREAEERIIDYAFQYAKDNNRTKVTAVHKANVLKKTDGLFKEIFYEVGEKYPDIDTEDFYVDATAMYLVTQPQEFQVIVTTNLFGDILSDEGAGLVGGLGLIPSANIGSEGALFEPVHGSAPDIAGQQKANPIAMMLSAVMMLRYLGENEEADKFDASILKVLSEGKTLTSDLGGSATTMEVAQAIKDAFYEVGEKYPDIDTEDFYVDATAMYLVTQPQEFQVIVTTNLFGDILSDEGAGLVGGLGLIPSANIGSEGALFEPVHGSAPDIAGQQKANPIAMMLSAVMMLRYLGENEEADKFDASILKVLSEGKTLTSDLGGSATTMEVAQAIKDAL